MPGGGFRAATDPGDAGDPDVIVNIALVNGMAIFCHEPGVDLWDAIRCAASKAGAGDPQPDARLVVDRAAELLYADLQFSNSRASH